MGAKICSYLIDTHLCFFRHCIFVMPHCDIFFIKVIKTIEFWYINYQPEGVAFFYMLRVVDFLDVHGKGRG